MELRHLRYFVAVAEELHFGRAAARLHMAQPPLSQQIQSLEEELGVQLLQRTKRSVQLTDAGIVFLEEARLTLAQAEQAIVAARRASKGEIGRLVIGFVGSASYSILPTILRAFRERFPDVELVLHELTTTQQVRALRDGRITIGFIRSAVNDETLAAETVLREQLVVALPEHHALSMLPHLSLRALASEPFILFPRHLGPSFYDQIVSMCHEAGFSPNVVQEAIEMQTIVSLVAAEIGVAIVPASLQYLRRARVIYKNIQVEKENGIPEAEIAMLWRKEDTAPILQAFLRVAREQKTA